MQKKNEISKSGASSRVINFRPLFYGFIAFAIGILFCYYVFKGNLTYIFILVSAFIVCFGFAIFKKQFLNFLVIVVCLFAGFGAYFIDYGNFNTLKVQGQSFQVSGRVSTNIYNYDKYLFVVLDNVKLNGNKRDNLALDIYKIQFDYSLDPGTVINFNAKVYDEFLFENEVFNSFAYKMKTPYSAEINSEDITIQSENNLTFAEKVRYAARTLLHSYMSFETAELSYSILFGDQVQLDSQIKDNFATSGIGHLIAVSGLNTAVLVACLYWLLRKCHCVGVPRLCIVAVLLLFYCYLCSFTPSVVRASVMSLVFLTFQLFGRQYDILSSLGVAGLIILIFNPLQVFDVGFQLSFISVAAIGLFVQPMTKFFNKKCKIPQKLSNALAIDLCTTIAILPIFALYFGKLSLFSFLTNLICVPIFSFAYILIFALVLIVAVFRFLGFLFVIPEFLLNVIVWFSGIIAGLNWSIIQLYTFTTIGIFAYFLIIFFFSKMFLKTNFIRLLSASSTIIIALLGIFAFNVPVKPNSFTYTQLNAYSPCAVLTSKRGEVLVIGSKATDFLEEYLTYKKLSYIDTLILTNNFDTTSDFAHKYKIKNYLSTGSNLEYYGSFGIKFIVIDTITKGVYVNVDNVGILFAFEKIGSLQVDKVSSLLSAYKVDILYEQKQNLNFKDVGNFEYVLSGEQIDAENNFATKLRGSFTFSINNDIIQPIRSFD